MVDQMNLIVVVLATLTMYTVLFAVCRVNRGIECKHLYQHCVCVCADIMSAYIVLTPKRHFITTGGQTHD